MASQGPLLVGTGADDATVGTLVWATPTNITAADDVRATRAIATTLTTHYLKGTNCGFTIPAGATIDGIIVEIDRHKTNAASQVRDSAVRIVKADGSIGSTNKGATSTDWPNTAAAEAIATYGTSSDLWGETWTVADVNDADFGAVVAATNPSATTGSGLVDFIRITVYYTAGAAAVNIPLDTTTAASAATLAPSAQTQVPLAASASQSAALLAASAPTDIPLGASAGVSISAFSLRADAVIVLGVVSATSLGTLGLQVPAGLPLETAIATATAVLAISATTGVALAPSAGISTATLQMAIPVDRWLPSTDTRWNQDTDDLWQTTSEGSWAGV